MTDLKKLTLDLHSLVLFREITCEPTISKFISLMEIINTDNSTAAVAAYSDFCASLFSNKLNLSDYILKITLENENIYLLRRAREQKIETQLEQCLQNELKILQHLASVTSTQVKNAFSYDGFLPEWENSDYDFTAIYQERMKNIHTHGYGIFANYHMFTLKNSNLIPVKHPDETRLNFFTGYEYERECVLKNTLALLEGKPAANVLLYGDSGTGKSSTVKAVANEFSDRGLRLIELQKNQLREIPQLIDTLGKNPLKFILFIDDLSFTQEDNDFGALKAILEGSVSARTKNLAVYATSNRRHLVRETFSDREGDEVHLNDTLQQLTSLSERFGLTITFSRPNRDQYFELITHLADIYGVTTDQDTLFRHAEIYALERGGRSPRVAKQFIEQVQAIGLQ